MERCWAKSRVSEAWLLCPLEKDLLRCLSLPLPPSLPHPLSRSLLYLHVDGGQAETVFWDEFDRAWARDAYGRLVRILVLLYGMILESRTRMHRLPDLDRQR